MIDPTAGVVTSEILACGNHSAITLGTLGNTTVAYVTNWDLKTVSVVRLG